MATTHSTQERTTDNQQASTYSRRGEIEQHTHWFVVAADIVGSALLFAGVLLSAGIAAAYLAAVLPGLAGIAVFFTVGLGLIGAAPEVALWVRRVAFEALEPYLAS